MARKFPDEQRKRPRFETTLAPKTRDFLRRERRAGVLIDELVEREIERRNSSKPPQDE